jgi:hypothetical protein
MVKEGKEKLAWGPSALIYDQLGGRPAYPCFGLDPSVKPTTAFTAGRLHLLRAIRSNLKQVRPDFGFMVESNIDIYAQHVDIVHCAGEGCMLTGKSYPQPFRYTFPEIILTARDQAPRVDAKQINYALAYGLRFELEVRYRADVDTLRNQEMTELRDYLKSVSGLRDRYWDLLGSGRFRDTDGLENRNASVTATVFEGGARRGVVVWNNTRQAQLVKVSYPGKKLIESACVKGKLASAPATLQPQEVALLVFE